MQRNGFHPTETEMNHLFPRFDRNQNGFVSYQEFMDEILPKTSLLGETANINMLKKQDPNSIDEMCTNNSRSEINYNQKRSDHAKENEFL